MTWFKVDDSLHAHKKAMRAGVEAMGLWVLAGSWSGDQLTDGWIPEYAVHRWSPRADELAERLVHAGLWIAGENADETGWWFHDWARLQPSRQDVLAERAYNTRKASLYRDPDLLKTIRTRDCDRCRYCGVLVNWKDRRGRAGATYDYIDPDGSNTLENVVVACRSCVSSKGERTAADAGMGLLEPGSMGPAVSSYKPDANQNITSPRPDPTRPDPTRASLREAPAVASSEPRRPNAAELAETASDPRTSKVLRAWRATHDPKYSGGTYTAVGKHVAAALAEGHSEQLVAAALAEWDRRPDAKPGLLPHLIDDIVHAERPGAAKPAVVNGKPTVPVEQIPDDAINPDEILGQDYWTLPAPPRELENTPAEADWVAQQVADRKTQRVAEARRALIKRQNRSSA